MPFQDGTYKIFYGNSSLAAKVTGMLSKKIAELSCAQICIEKLMELCNKELERKHFSEYSVETEKKIEEIKEKIEEDWIAFISIASRYSQSNETLKNYYRENGQNLLEKLETNLGYNLKYTKFSLGDFSDFMKLARKCVIFRYKET